MATLNLTANTKSQELILAYLQENASDVLAEKINSGTPFEKDGKQLVNKKTLDGFMKFATDEARKFAEKGANSACVEDSVVYGWAIHYFEEDSIQGKLYNQDGTEYTPPKPIKKTATTKPVVTKPVEPPKPKQQQASLWDMLEAENKTAVTEQPDDHEVVEQADDSPTVEEIADKLQQALDEKNSVKPEPKKELPVFYEQYVNMKTLYPNDIVLERLGDFYEAFNEDATILSDELDLTLTGRNVGLESRVPLVGFPYHVSDAYIAKIRQKHSVVIIESNGEIVTLGKTSTPVCKDDLPDDDIDGIEELSEPEMRQFDGDIQEPKTIDDTDCEEESMPPYSPSSFDKETMIYLYDLLDGKLDIA